MQVKLNLMIMFLTPQTYFLGQNYRIFDHFSLQQNASSLVILLKFCAIFFSLETYHLSLTILICPLVKPLIILKHVISFLGRRAAPEKKEWKKKENKTKNWTVSGTSIHHFSLLSGAQPIGDPLEKFGLTFFLSRGSSFEAKNKLIKKAQ